MANIDTELQTIATAIYGRDMRSAIHDAIEKVNTESGNNKDTITSITDDVADLSNTVTSISDDVDALKDSVTALDTVTVYPSQISGNGILGSCRFERVGKMVSFEIIFTVPNPLTSGDYVTIPVTLPTAFIPKYTNSSSQEDSVTKNYPIVPTPVDSSGNHPYLRMISTYRLTSHSVEFRAYNMTSGIIGTLPSGTEFIVTGVYTTAVQSTT
jgi:hypothetical protein